MVNVIKRKVKVLWSPGEDPDDNAGKCHKMKSESSLVTRWRAHAMYCPPNASCPECPFVLIICLFHHQQIPTSSSAQFKSPRLPICPLLLFSKVLSYVPNICRDCPSQQMQGMPYMQCTFETYHCHRHLEPGQDCFITPLGGIRGGPQLRGGSI